MFPLRGRGPYAAGWAGNTRGDKFGVLERGVEQDLITRGTGATPFVAGNLPADRQVRSSRPPQGEHPTPELAPRLSLCFTPTFTAPEGVRIFNMEITRRALERRARDLFAKYAAVYLAKSTHSRTKSARPAISNLKYGRPQAQ